MINLQDGQLTDIIPTGAARSAEAQSYSSALRIANQRTLQMADRASFWAMLDAAPDNLLDILAWELRAPYYSDDLPIAVKRDIIQRSLPWHYTAGTAGAVQELINVVFGDGRLIEWWDFDDAATDPQPYMFDIQTNAPLQPDTRAQLLQMIDKVKNVRSHLRILRFERKPERRLSLGHSSLVIRRHHTAGGPMDVARYTSAQLTAVSVITIPRRRTAAVRRETHTTSAALAMSVQVIRRRIVH